MAYETYSGGGRGYKQVPERGVSRSASRTVKRKEAAKAVYLLSAFDDAETIHPSILPCKMSRSARGGSHGSALFRSTIMPRDSERNSVPAFLESAMM